MSGLPEVLLVGVGAMGSRHARVIQQSGIARLGAVVDPREEVGGAVATQYGAAWFCDLDDIDDLGRFDAVVVAAATEAHHPIAMRMLAAGLPLLIEKPVADSLDATMDVLGTSLRLDIPIMCGFVERFNPAVIAARSMIETPTHVIATRHSPYAPRIQTGVRWDLLVHDIDLVVTVFGAEPVEVQGMLGQYDRRSVPGADDVADALLRFPSGGIGHVSASRVSQRKVRSLWIHEVDKLIDVDLLRRDVTVYRHVADRAADDDGRGYRQETIIEIPEIASMTEPLAAQFQHFVSLVEGRVDAAAERASIATPHRVVSQLATR